MDYSVLEWCVEGAISVQTSIRDFRLKWTLVAGFCPIQKLINDVTKLQTAFNTPPSRVWANSAGGVRGHGEQYSGVPGRNTCFISIS